MEHLICSKLSSAVRRDASRHSGRPALGTPGCYALDDNDSSCPINLALNESLDAAAIAVPSRLFCSLRTERNGKLKKRKILVISRSLYCKMKKIWRTVT